MALLLSPMVQARRLFSRRLGRVSPFIKGNELAEARRLNRAGYHAAAVVLARIAVEKRFKEKARANPKWKGKATTLDCTIRFCYTRAGISQSCYVLARNFKKQANSVAHGNQIDRARAWLVIRRAAMIISLMEGGVA